MFEGQTSRSLLNPKQKILNWEDAGAVSRKLKNEGKRVVFTNGCFDLIHAGHAAYLLEARKFGDFLFVGINSDASVRRIKGEKRPIVKERERVFLIASLFFVDRAVIFDEDTPYELIKIIEPDILIKGEDWQVENIVGRDVVLAKGGEVKTIPLMEGLSTSKIIEKIIKTHSP